MKYICTLVLGLALSLAAHATQTDITGPTGSGAFGTSVTVLPNGNFVVVDPTFDTSGPTVVDVGAVYLYSHDGTLISTLKGSAASDQVGSGGITVLTNGNFVVRSPLWDNGAVTQAGAVTWCSGTMGLNGTVSASNSLVGSTASDAVGSRAGSNGIFPLTNGNYVVVTSVWDAPGAANAGAITWCDGTTGRSGTLSSANSLIGATAGDQTGSNFLVTLPNGNYVIGSPFVKIGGITVGAVTWGNGTTGTVGTISSANSLVGGTSGDGVGGTNSVIVLANSNYLVRTSQWDNGAVVNAGAVTWGSGTSGVSGIISPANSLVGSTANDSIGGSGLTTPTILALSNGNYVVGSPTWDNGAVVDAGASTWGSGTSGVVGIVSTANSLVGSTASDQVGGSGAVLGNGNYVVSTPNWDNGATTNVGAATWCNGSTGRTGAISAANALIGTTAADQVGASVLALTNGNYVVGSPQWNNGSTVDVGAATWCNGTTGRTGNVTAANSLIGSTASDTVANVAMLALTNGNYVARSTNWDNGATANVGAVTWCDGNTGRTGTISVANSYIGSTANDTIGNVSILALNNGNYVFSSTSWDGVATNVGAVTWGNGTTGSAGALSSSNSFVGSTATDGIGNVLTALSDGNYAFVSNAWDNGATINAGAASWGNGSTGSSGGVISANSVVGSTASDSVGTLTAVTNGRYIVNSTLWNNGATADAGAITLGLAGVATAGAVSSTNSYLGAVASNGTNLVFAYDPTFDQLVVGDKTSNKVSIVSTVPPLSNNANLSSLALSAGTLSSVFDANTTAYTASVARTVSSITITQVVEQPNATVLARINGGAFGSPSATFALNVGANTLDVKVTAQNGTTVKTYSVVITRLNAAPVASDGALTTNEDTDGSSTLVATDADADTLSYSIVASPTHGTLNRTGAAFTYTPTADYNGSDSFTFKANDGFTDSNVATVSITVVPINDGATLSDITNKSTLQDTPTSAIPFTVNDIDTSLASLTLIASSSNPTLVPTGGFLFGGSGTSRTLTITPALLQHGIATITVSVSDGEFTASDTFVLTVNDAPVATANSLVINEDTAISGTLAASDLNGDTLTYSIVTSPAHGSLNRTGTAFTYTLAANYNGPDSFRFKANDGITDSNVATVSLTVNPVNDTPTISNITDASTFEDTPTGAIAFTIGDIETSAAALIVTTSSSNQSIVPDANIVLGGSSASRSLVITPSSAVRGNSIITVTVSDGELSASDTFLLTVNAAPIASNGTLTTDEDTTASGTLAATDADNNSLTYSIVASPTNGSLSRNGSAFSYTPATNYNGTDSFTFKANDGFNDSNVATVSITVNAVNDRPTITDITNKVTPEDTPSSAIAFTIGDAETSAASLTLTTTSSNQSLVPDANIALGGSGANHTLTITPTLHQRGTATVTVTVSDGDLSASESFVLTVNDVPVVSNLRFDNTVLPGLTINASGTVSVQATDDQGIARVEFFYTQGGGAPVKFATDTSAGDGLSGTFAVSQLPDGLYNITATAFDPNNEQAAITQALTLALVAPSAPAITAPAAGITTDQVQLTITGSCNREARIRIERDGNLIAGPVPPASNGSFSFNVSLLEGNNTFTATASNRAGDSPAVTRSIEYVREFPLLAVTTPSPSVREDEVLTGTVSIAPVPTQPVTVLLSSSLSARVAVPSSVTILANNSSATFPISGVQNEILDPIMTSVISASGAQLRTGSKSVQVLDDDWPLLTLTLESPWARENDGPQATFVTVSRDVARPFAQTVYLSSDAPTAAIVPASVTIAANQASVRVPVAAVNDASMDGVQNAHLRAWVTEFRTNAIVSESPLVTLEVQDDEGPTIELLVVPVVLHEGGSFPNGGIVRLPAVASQSTVVTLGSIPGALVTMPASVTVAEGEREVSFNLSVPTNATVEAPRDVRLSASATGLTSGVKRVFVTDAPMPDLIPSLVLVPNVGESSTSVSVRFRIENRGTAPVTGRQAYRIYLSPDATLGDDTLAAQVITMDTLAVDGMFERTEDIRLPQAQGNIFVIVDADTEGSIAEASESNNVSVSVQPIVVAPGYTAVASVAGSMFPVGTTVAITGQASRSGGAPATRVPVKLRVAVNGMNRDVNLTSANDGTFAYSFLPVGGECGNYSVTAAHPATSFGAAQDSFSIVGIKPAGVPEIVFDDGSSNSATIQLTNPAGVLLHGLVATLVSPVSGVDVTLSLPPGAVLGSSASVPLTVIATGQTGVSGGRTITIDITTAEGITVRILVPVTIRPLRPQIVFNPTRISNSVLRGTQKTVLIDLENSGRAASGDLQVLLPDLPMLSLASPALIPSLAPGGRTQVNLLITPSATEALTVTNGSILFFSPETGTMSLPFDIRVTSDSRGDLTVAVQDEFTYFAEGSPLVQGAQVRLRDAITGVPAAAPITTTATGLAFFPLLNEGHYELEVSAPNHATYRGDIVVQPGPANRQNIFITREAVSYQWTVTETAVQDRYKIEVNTTFETNVPAPVVTVTPGQVDLAALQAVGDEMQVDFVIENHGFITAQHGAFAFSTHPWYVIEPLISEVGTIAAKTAITVPAVVRRIGPVPAGLAAQAAVAKKSAATSLAPPPATPVPCAISGGLAFDYICGVIPVPKTVPIAFSNVDGDCARPGGFGGSFVPVFGGPGADIFPHATGGAPGRPGSTPISFSLPKACDCFVISKDFEAELDAEPIAAAIRAGLGRALPPPLQVESVEVDLKTEGDAETCCPLDWAGSLIGTAEITAVILIGTSLPEISPDIETGDWHEIEMTAGGFAGAKATLTGSGSITLSKKCAGKLQLCMEGSIGGGLALGADFQASVTAEEKLTGQSYSGLVQATALLTGSVSVSASACNDEPLEVKACGTLGYELALGGTLEANGVMKQFGPHFSKTISSGDCAPDESAAAASGFAGAAKASERATAGVSPPPAIIVLPAVHYPGIATEPLGRPISETDEEIIALMNLPTAQSGVCAQVKMQLRQDLVLTRQGFEAELQLTNNQASENLTNLGFTMDIRTENGLPASDRFQVRTPDVTGFGNISGTGTLAPQSTGSSRWVLVPNDDAAPVAETTYFVGGEISYTEQGRSINIPVSAVPIRVRPNAALRVSYFHQRDVFADDPHTDLVEPAQPFYLGVLVQNDGYGEARNVKLTSGQPVILDNEKGLLVAFQQETAAVNGAAVQAGSTLDFGTIAPHGRSVGLFGMRGSLLGLFNSYEATFQHLDGSGDPRLSILKSTDIYEMNHLVQAARAGDDTLPDFLTNDIADANDQPDTLHHSTGAVEPVSLVANAVTGAAPTFGSPTTTLTASIPANAWGYVKIADPSHGAMQLTSVLRSDGVNILVGRNVWTTNRTMPGLGQPAIAENVLHLLDFGGTGQYQLTFTIPPVDLTAPTSEIAALPAQSSPLIPLTWTASDASALAGIDIFVSDDGGPFTLWRERTTLVGATYSGVLGHTYAFYSIGTDITGNREAVPAVPDATTTVSLVNAAPVIAPVGILQVSEGQALNEAISAQDPDGPLLYELQAGAPAGLVLGALGELSWTPGEPQGGGVYPVTVRVTDRGLPQASAESSFTIVVNEANSAPVPTPQLPRSLTAGETVIVALSASDPDTPTQTLTWRLIGTQPPELSLSASTGLLTVTTQPSQTTRTITALAEVRDSFSTPGLATVPLSFYIAAGGGSTNHPPVKLANLTDRTAKRGIHQVIASFDGIFNDMDSGDVLSFSVAGNSAPEFVTGATVNAGAKQVVLNLSEVVAGQSIITLQATDIGGLSVQVPLRIVSHPYLQWAYQKFGSPGLDPMRESDLWGNTIDHDSDGLKTLQEFAFGNEPEVSDTGSLEVSAGTISRRGLPMATSLNEAPTTAFRAIFGRRKNFLSADLIYSTEFSANLSDWEPSVVAPVIIATDTEFEAVSVPFPSLLLSGLPPKFFRVSVSLAP